MTSSISSDSTLHNPSRPKAYPVQIWTDDQPKSLPAPSENQGPIPQQIRAVKDSNVPGYGRTIVVCLDGTGDSFDNDNSNVVNFVACLKKDDPSQITYYQAGIGTYGIKGLQGGFSAAIDMAVGSSLGIHIRDAYRFLMQTYREGDRICLLGFSRGSYTVRCLGGVLHKVGLLPAHNSARIITFAYKFYKDDSPYGMEDECQLQEDILYGCICIFCRGVEFCCECWVHTTKTTFLEESK